MEQTKIIIFKGYWSIDDVNNYPHALFVYGDNNVHKGEGGQAIIRNLPNIIGIPTKKYPSNHPDAFYSDIDYVANIRNIDNAINSIILRSKSYKYVVLPEDGFGTGLARLPTKAPKTYNYLLESIDRLKKLI